jgi:predicted amidophosphoribosyltransferase
MEEIPVPLLCPVCHQPVTPEEYFCPNCGKSLKEKPPSTRWWTQLGLYALSVCLPPLGLWPAWKYLRSADQSARRVGWIAVALTAVSLVASIFLFQIIMNQLTQSLNASLGGLL